MCVTDPWAHMSFMHSILSLKLGVTIAHTIPFLAYETFMEREAMINEWSNHFVDGKNMFLRNSRCKS